MYRLCATHAAAAAAAAAAAQVRKSEDGRIYAMKILKKEMVLRRKQFEHTLSERRILANIDHPFIVSLRFAFQVCACASPPARTECDGNPAHARAPQTEHKLYMVFGASRWGEGLACAC